MFKVTASLNVITGYCRVELITTHPVLKDAIRARIIDDSYPDRVDTEISVPVDELYNFAYTEE